MTEPQLPERTTYRVGEPFHPDMTNWPEGQQFELRFGLPGLLLFYPNPRPDEVLAVARRHISLALFAEADQLLLLYQVGATEWAEAAFTPHLAGPDFVLPAVDRELPMPVFLIDANTGIIAALCAVTLERRFVEVLHAALTRQLAWPWDEAAYDARLAELRGRFPHPGDLLVRAQVLHQA